MDSVYHSNDPESRLIFLCYEALMQKLRAKPDAYTGRYERNNGKIVTRRMRERDLDIYQFYQDEYTLAEITKKVGVSIATVHEGLRIAEDVVQTEFRKECL